MGNLKREIIMKTRKISEKQEMAIRLRSGELDGLSAEEAAAKMGISQQALTGLLRRAEIAVPELFPLLTKQEAEVMELEDIDGMNGVQIADTLFLSPQRVSQIVRSIAKKRGDRNKPVVMEHYESHMDSKVVESF